MVTNLDGRTDVAGLYAIGETACTGLHGANRLASNSLLECMVFARAAARQIAAAPGGQAAPGAVRPWRASSAQAADVREIEQRVDDLRRLMWRHVGIVRSGGELDRAAQRIAQLRRDTEALYAQARVTRELIELRNLLQTADLIVQSARSRHESRGLHYRLDHPEPAAYTAPTLLAPVGH